MKNNSKESTLFQVAVLLFCIEKKTHIFTVIKADKIIEKRHFC